MQFCDGCGTLLPAGETGGACPQCSTSTRRPDGTGTGGEDDETRDAEPAPTDLEQLPTTESGSVRKADAVEWLARRDRPSTVEHRRATVEKPSGFSGSTFPTDISTVRLTGDAAFIETAAGLFSWVVGMEDYSRRVEVNLKQVEEKESGERTGNYALYLSVAERG
ncbi:hypothetical protein [Salinigranum sp.]|uniref:hypothetical protein n=1 Tax=Salinigranum sp. TaxID=1966351 RepID=UPI003561A717